jgi:outer membrane protein OmpA-like peptidoglycan-associated protein
MKTRMILIVLLSLLFSGQIFAAGGTELQVSASKPGNIVTVEREIDDGKVLLSVSDAAKNPMFGLTISDFVVTMGGRTAKITSVQPVAESLDVPRNIVLVLDNSDSMRQRDAVGPLLAGVDELLKIVRPIDQVQIVVFSKKKINIGGRDLSVRTFKSNKPGELKNFVSNVYRDGITSTTVLYEGMLAGIELIRALPANEPRFMVVFSDGEDLNSDYKSDDVFKAMEGLARFNTYAIDYMPGAAIDKFLATFAEQNNGEIWKATSETNLVPIFQSVASKMQYYYVVSYLFPTTGSLAVVPASVAIDEIAALDASARSEQFAGAAPAKSAFVVSRIDASALTLRPVVDTVYGIAGWKVALANTGGTLAEQSGKGTPPAEIAVPLKTDDLGGLAAGGDIKVTMEMQDRKGQIVVLTAPPVKVNYFRTTGSLGVAPASVAIDEIEALDASARSEQSAGAAPAKSASVVSRIDVSALTLRPVVASPHGIAGWKVALANTGGTMAEQSGKGTPPAEVVVPLKTDDLGGLAAGGDIKVTMEMQDRKGQIVVLTAPPVKVNYFRTMGSLAVAPASVTIEEIKTIDASPLLGHIYFSRGASDLPVQYVRLAGPEEAKAFDEQRFRDTLEKYYQVLNIIGKRMTNHPEAVITLTGCNDNTVVEKGNRKLSTRRAEAVRDYLQAVWGIAPERIRIEARNLPKMPSTSRLEEGKADNRRVEITSENPAILDLIRSSYLATRIDTAMLTLHPVITAPHGVAAWTVAAANNRQKLGELAGDGAPPAEIKMPLSTSNLNEMAAGGDITVRMEVQDRKRQELAMTASPVRVNFVQTSQLLAQKQEFRVQEKYALILFDFDSDIVDARNQEIVNTIVTRIKELPQATVDIVGHTDNIGKEGYNIKLSERRALAVYKLLTAAYGEDPGERLRYSGVGPLNPLYDNTTSEARAFNRTVTITLEYMAGN